jgi:hypothetical protein
MTHKRQCIISILFALKVTWKRTLRQQGGDTIACGGGWGQWGDPITIMGQTLVLQIYSI